jgi:hypothetical protein
LVALRIDTLEPGARRALQAICVLGDQTTSEQVAELVPNVEDLDVQLEQLESLIDGHPRILYAVMCSIVRTVHQVQTRLSMQASELTNYIVKQHGRY